MDMNNAIFILSGEMHALARRIEQRDENRGRSGIVTMLHTEAGRLHGIAKYARMSDSHVLEAVQRDFEEAENYYKWAQDVLASMREPAHI